MIINEKSFVSLAPIYNFVKIWKWQLVLLTQFEKGGLSEVDLKGYRVLTICKGNPEILVGKSNVLHPSFWRTSESMGCDLRGGNFRTLFSLFCCFGYFIHCGGSFSQHVKFYSFIFMHKISSRVICVNGKHPLVY